MEPNQSNQYKLKGSISRLEVGIRELQSWVSGDKGMSFRQIQELLRQLSYAIDVVKKSTESTQVLNSPLRRNLVKTSESELEKDSL